MTQQWLRVCSLTVGGASGSTDLSQLRIRFQTHQETTQSPGAADITITNPAPKTVNGIKEYDKVVLVAGYPGNAATIFEGEVVQKRYGRENPTDTFLHLICKESQKAYSYATMSKTLAAGHTFKDQVNACLEALAPYGVTAGYIADMGSTTMPRGRALFGMVREQLRAICRSVGADWRITGTKLEIFKKEEGRQGSAIVLNSKTGLIGMPVQTFDGVEARCLLNPEIKPASIVKIDQKSVIEAAKSLAYGAEAQNAMLPSVAADGLYKVYLVEHHGDTRGNDWYTDIICIALNGGGVAPARATQTLPSVLGQ